MRGEQVTLDSSLIMLFSFLRQEPPVNSLLSLVCFQDSSSSAGPAPAAEQQGTAPKVQLPLNV